MIVPMMRPEEAARYLGLSTSTLAKMRVRGDGPPFVKLGKKLVAYETAELEDWLERHRRTSTSG